MPSTRSERLRTLVRASAPWRKLAPDRTVRRHVQGVDLYLPWSHLLPDYAKSRPSYGQNLVELAALLAAPMTSQLQLLDIGANIGDSAAQIIARTGARALCVEADPYWTRYLQANLGHNPDVAIEEVLLTAEATNKGPVAPQRIGGTTHFVASETNGAKAPISVVQLREGHPDFAALRLVKSDTDGFDPVLVPAVARAWADAKPVLFFEFDPILARDNSASDPNQVWAELAELGYEQLVVWDNAGDPLGRLATADAAAQAATLDPRPVHLGYHFWDVAAAHRDDAVALAAFAQLAPEPFDVRGIRR